MKTKIRKTFLFFISHALPLHWVLGFSTAMLYNNERVKANFLLYFTIRVALLIIFGKTIEYMNIKEIKGWYAVVCELVSIGVFVLSMLVYVTS